MAFSFFKKKEKNKEFSVPPPVPKIPKPTGASDLDIPPAPASEEDLPVFPEIPEIKEEVKPRNIVPLPKPKPIKLSPIEEKGEDIEKDLFNEEKEEFKLKEEHKIAIQPKPIFIRMESFQSIIDELNQVRSIAKESDDAISRVGDFTGDQEKEFNRWQSMLNDLQKKFIFIDKTLFKQ